MRCIRCEKSCCDNRCCQNCCEVCGSYDLYINCQEYQSGGGCAEVLFWGFMAVATFGVALIIPLLLFRDNKKRKCVAVCRRCGHIQEVR